MIKKTQSMPPGHQVGPFTKMSLRFSSDANRSTPKRNQLQAPK